MLPLDSFEALRSYVRGVLCDRADLDERTPLLETPLVRRGAECGVEFTLVGPRSYRLSAIYEVDANRILFYDHDLTRFQTTPVSGATLKTNGGGAGPVFKSMWSGK
ncbi:MAG: hypothetical protein ACRDD1_05540 [Planctomycetia bacterium]